MYHEHDEHTVLYFPTNSGHVNGQFAIHFNTHAVPYCSLILCVFLVAVVLGRLLRCKHDIIYGNW